MTGEKCHRGGKLARVHRLKEIGHEPALLEAPRCGLESPAQPGEVGEERHRPILRGGKTPPGAFLPGEVIRGEPWRSRPPPAT